MKQSLKFGVLFLWMILWGSLLNLKAQKPTEREVSWTREQKVYAFSKFWAEAKRNYVYMYKIGNERWDSLYCALLPEVLASSSNWDFIRIMRRFCASLQDGHTRIHTGEQGISVTMTAFREFYLGTRYVDGHLVVSEVDQAHAEEIPLCTEIVEIDGMPTSKYLAEQVLPYVSASASHVRMEEAGKIALRALKGTKRDVTFRIGKQLKTLTLVNEWVEGHRYGDIVTYPAKEWAEKGQDFEMKWLTDEVAYVRIGTFSKQEVINRFEEIFPSLKKARGLVLDIRNNGGGSSGRASHLLSYLTSKNQVVGSKWSTRCYKPSFASWGQGYWGKGAVTVQDTIGNAYKKELYLQAHDLGEYTDGKCMMGSFREDRAYIEVPTAVLTNSGTASASEDFLIFADRVTNLFRVGEPTNGSTGQPIYIPLIPDLRCQICTKKDTYPDGREFVGYGITPHVSVPLTVETMKEKKDVQLEVALREVKKRIR